MLVAEFLAGSTVLHDTLSAFTEVTLQHEERYRTDDTVRMLFWMSGVDEDSFETALEADPTVTNPRRLAEIDSSHLYRVDLTDVGREKSTYSTWVENGVVLLDARGTQNGWRIRMRFPDRETVIKYREAFVERGCSFRLLSLYRETDADAGAAASLSPTQREALVTAYERGYFEVPRAVTQEELGELLGITSQSMSERLRRAVSALIESTLRRR